MALNYGAVFASPISKSCQSKILCAVVDAPCFVINDMIHRDLGIPAVHDVIHDRNIKHRTKLEPHSNPSLQLLPQDVTGRLKRRCPADCNKANEISSLEGTSSRSFGGLEVACWPLVPKFAGSHPAEVVGFLGRKNPQHAFLRRGIKSSRSHAVALRHVKDP
jgi:hypothetical protein